MLANTRNRLTTAQWFAGNGRPIWFALLAGPWMRDNDHGLHHAGTVYRVIGSKQVERLRF